MSTEAKKLRRVTITTVIAAVILLAMSSLASADIVELDLFDLGCQELYDFNSPSWTTDFDLGITFTEISNVYIDWSGEITAGLAVEGGSDPFPLDVGIGAYLEKPPNWRHTILGGGEETYPHPEPFDNWSEFQYGGMPWSELFDGQGTITIEYQEPVSPDVSYVQHGSIVLDSAILVVDGVVVPEPTTLLFIVIGAIGIRAKRT